MITTYPSSFSSSKEYSTAIFDLGSVLIKFDSLLVEKLLGNDVAIVSARECKTIMHSPPFQRCAAGLISMEEAFKELPQRFPSKKIEIVKKHPLAHALRPLEEGEKLFAYIRPRVEKVYILSNIIPPSFEYIAQHTHFVKDADGYVVSYEAKSRKPDAEIYRQLLKKYNIVPGSALFIDDLKENCQAAAFLGIDSLVCDYRENIQGFIQDLHFTKKA